jgi:hypothetical protein
MVSQSVHRHFPIVGLWGKSLSENLRTEVALVRLLLVERRNRMQDLIHRRTELLAYAFWQARGCPEGSPDEDWFLAEEQLRHQYFFRQAKAA